MRLEHAGKIQSASLISASETDVEEVEAAAAVVQEFNSELTMVLWMSERYYQSTAVGFDYSSQIILILIETVDHA